MSKDTFPQNPAKHLEDAQDVARALAKTKAFEQSRHDRKRVGISSASCDSIVCDCAAREALNEPWHSVDGELSAIA
jgi:hypothetical protein